MPEWLTLIYSEWQNKSDSEWLHFNNMNTEEITAAKKQLYVREK